MTTTAKANLAQPHGVAGSMNRDEILAKFQAHKHILAEWFGVTGLALFGSFTRDQATDGCDVDILGRFDGSATSRTYFGVQFYVEDLLGLPVDPVTEKVLRHHGLTEEIVAEKLRPRVGAILSSGGAG